MDLITPEIGLLFWQTIVFLVLILILAKFAWRPILELLKNEKTRLIMRYLQLKKLEKKCKILRRITNS